MAFHALPTVTFSEDITEYFSELFRPRASGSPSLWISPDLGSEIEREEKERAACVRD